MIWKIVMNSQAASNYHQQREKTAELMIANEADAARGAR